MSIAISRDQREQVLVPFDNHKKARKQASTLYNIVKKSFTEHPANDIKLWLKKTPQEPDPCQELQDVVNDSGQSVLHEAVHQGQEGLVKLFLKEGYDINGQNSAGNTALHVAILLQNKPIFKILLKKEPNLLVENLQGETVAGSDQ
jgi:hypothetical protein